MDKGKDEVLQYVCLVVEQISDMLSWSQQTITIVSESIVTLKGKTMCNYYIFWDLCWDYYCTNHHVFLYLLSHVACIMQ